MWLHVFEHVRDAFVIFDTDAGTCLDANPAAAALLATTVDAIRGASLVELSPRVQANGTLTQSLVQRCLGEYAPVRDEQFVWTFQRATGELVNTNVRVSPVPAHGTSSLVCFQIVEVVQAAAPSPAVAPSLQVANQQLLDEGRQRSKFLSSVSHELRSPLHTIIGFSELLYAGHIAPSAPEHHESLGDILTSGRHLLQLIDDVLDLAALEHGHIAFHPQMVALRPLIDDVCAMTRPIEAASSIQLVLELDPTLDQVTVDPFRFKQVVFNYLSNAYRYVEAQGRIVVRTIAEGPDWFRVEVEDTGVGIAASELGHLFSEVATVPGSRLARGTGFGLALTRRLVEAQGGSVGARSHPESGSVFHARFRRVPRHEEDA